MTAVVPTLKSTRQTRWVCIVDGHEFPVKELVKAAANTLASTAPQVTLHDFQTAAAGRILRSLGFEVRARGPDA